MCHLNVEVDQSVHTVGPVFEAIESSDFYIRSARVVPVAWGNEASVHLSLGGGSMQDLNVLLADLQRLPGVISTHHTPMPA